MRKSFFPFKGVKDSLFLSKLTDSIEIFLKLFAELTLKKMIFFESGEN